MAWILLDIGNVLWCDDRGDALTRANLARALRARGLRIAVDELEAAQAAAVEARAPSAWRAVIRHFARGDDALYEAVLAETLARWRGLPLERYRDLTTPFPSSATLLEGLRADGHSLLLASNNEQRALDRLAGWGWLRHFERPEVSETLGLAKPDPRFFAAILAAADADPARCLMVGDRLGNDIAPAKSLGMKTLRLRLGSHAAQEPRGPAETPDATVRDPGELLASARRLIAAA